MNAARSDRGAAQAALAQEGIETRAHPLASCALEVAGSPGRLRQTRAWTSGIVELQDAASQAVVEDLGPLDGLRVLDYCAGGGGKALALAARGARVSAHDADPRRMGDIGPRAARAGTPVAVLDGPPPGGPGYEVVLCDAPCSGSGAWRRSPDAKWRLTPERLAELTALQHAILAAAAPLVAPGGRLVYATCSLLACENEDTVAAFLDAHPGWRCRFRRRISPLDGGDGFFAAHLEPPAAPA